VNYTIAVYGDQTFVRDGQGKTVGMVQPDHGGHGWAAWVRVNRPFGVDNYDFHSRHETRIQALAAVGYVEVAR
jgi:hypothetical protein